MQTHTQAHTYTRTLSQYEDRGREGGCTVTRLIGQMVCLFPCWANDSLWVSCVSTCAQFLFVPLCIPHYFVYASNVIMITVFRYAVWIPVSIVQ